MTNHVNKRKMTRFEKIAIALSVFSLLAIFIGGAVSGFTSMGDSMECVQQQQAVETYGITAENIEDNVELREAIEACGIELPESKS